MTQPVVEQHYHHFRDGSVIRVREWGTHTFDAVVSPPLTLGWRAHGGIWPTHPQALIAAYRELQSHGYGGDLTDDELEDMSQQGRAESRRRARGACLTITGIAAAVIVSWIVIVGVTACALLGGFG